MSRNRRRGGEDRRRRRYIPDSEYEEDEEYEDEYEEYDDSEYDDEYDEEYDEEYEDDEYEDDEDDEEYEERRRHHRSKREKDPRDRKALKRQGKKKKKKRHGFRNFIVILLVLAIILAFAGSMPGAKLGRLSGRCNILIAGTDAEGYRTDTLMLLSLNRDGTIRLLSIPRDTYVSDYWSSPKINSAIAVGGGGESGMQELMAQLEKLLGFAPDAYVLIRLDAFVDAVDALGGVDFNVPQDMVYEDPDQGLSINLQAGEQHLNGEQAMGLVRYRSGYANADIGRTEVQRDFVRTALKQWLSVKSLAALPKLWQIYQEEITTDLTPRNLLWIARVLLTGSLSSMETDVLPGWADMVGDSSVYMIDTAAAAEILKNYDPNT